VRGFLGIGDVFLITKEKENASVLKYKKQAESEKARADALAQEVADCESWRDPTECGRARARRA
jgi:hypothetical protein